MCKEDKENLMKLQKEWEASGDGECKVIGEREISLVS
jgi:hypothetical protein